MLTSSNSLSNSFPVGTTKQRSRNFAGNLDPYYRRTLSTTTLGRNKINNRLRANSLDSLESVSKSFSVDLETRSKTWALRSTSRTDLSLAGATNKNPGNLTPDLSYQSLPQTRSAKKHKGFGRFLKKLILPKVVKIITSDSPDSSAWSEVEDCHSIRDPPSLDSEVDSAKDSSSSHTDSCEDSLKAGPEDSPARPILVITRPTLPKVRPQITINTQFSDIETEISECINEPLTESILNGLGTACPPLRSAEPCTSTSSSASNDGRHSSGGSESTLTQLTPVQRRSLEGPAEEQDSSHLGFTSGLGMSVITRQMKLYDIIDRLASHGCKDMTTEIDISNSSEHPVERGGFGDVYRAVLHCNAEPVCIKSIRHYTELTKLSNPQYKAAQEGYTWSKISKCKHPNILEFLGLAVFRGQIVMVSPWMKGGTLARLLEDGAGVDIYSLCAQIASAIAYLHNEEIVHGDIKGANIMMTEDKTVLKLGDFGTAGSINQWSVQFSQGSGSSPVTTMRWAAPELSIEAGNTTPTRQSDVYSLGMTFLEIITGKMPFFGMSDIAVVRKIIKGEYLSRPEALLPSSSVQATRMWSLMTACWNYDPNKRPSASEVRNEIELIKNF